MVLWGLADQNISCISHGLELTNKVIATLDQSSFSPLVNTLRFCFLGALLPRYCFTNKVTEFLGQTKRDLCVFYRILRTWKRKIVTGRLDITVVTEVNSRKIDRKSERKRKCQNSRRVSHLPRRGFIFRKDWSHETLGSRSSPVTWKTVTEAFSFLINSNRPLG